MRGDRQRRAGRLRAGTGDRARRLVRLRVEVHRGRHGPGRAGPDLAPRSASGCAASRRRRSCARRAAAWRGSTSSSPREGQVLLNELNTIPGLHPHERLRAPVRGVGDRLRGAAGPAARATRSSGYDARARPHATAAPTRLAQQLDLGDRGARAPGRALRELRDPQQVVARRAGPRCRGGWSCASRPSRRCATSVQPDSVRGDAVARDVHLEAPARPSASRSASPRATIGRPASRYRPTPFFMLPRSGVS